MSENSLQVKRNDFLKVIAAIAMLVDHAAALPVFADTNAYIIMRSVGRIAFPIFAYYIAAGFINTHNLKKYVIRLFICAVISQIPYTLYFKNYLGLNIIFTFLIAAAVIYFIKLQWHYTAVVIALLPVCIEILFHISFDYSIYGIITVVIFYLFMDKPHKAGIIFTIATLLFSIYMKTPMQMLAVLSVPLIFIRPPIYVKVPKYFFYYFYPVHLMVLYMAGILTNL
ncbi:MAG: TraX family protein [Eubacteriaceae bacterium]